MNKFDTLMYLRSFFGDSPAIEIIPYSDEVDAMTVASKFSDETLLIMCENFEERTTVDLTRDQATKLRDHLNTIL